MKWPSGFTVFNFCTLYNCVSTPQIMARSKQYIEKSLVQAPIRIVLYLRLLSEQLNWWPYTFNKSKFIYINLWIYLHKSNYCHRLPVLSSFCTVMLLQKTILRRTLLTIGFYATALRNRLKRLKQWRDLRCASRI